MTGYADRAYWAERYARQDGDGDGDWLGDWALLRDCLGPALRRGASVLHLGCGDSRLPEALIDEGVGTQVAIDFAPVVVARAARRAGRPGLRYAVMDAGALALGDACFDVVIDKGTLDAVACADDEGAAAARMGAEARRVLRPGGTLISVSLRSTRMRWLDPTGTRGRVIAVPKPGAAEDTLPELASIWVYVVRPA